MRPKFINPDDLTIGSNIRAIRHARGISQAKMSEFLGITSQQVQKYENGLNRVGAGRLVQLTRALSCTLEDLFSGTTSSVAEPISLPMLSTQANQIARDFDLIKSQLIRSKVMALIASLAAPVTAGSDED